MSKRLTTRRRGLAPLELVLWLPVLLFVMAMMVNYGTMLAWRVRGEVVSRDAVWRSRSPRGSGGEPAPAPPVWPTGAGMGVSGGSAWTVLDHPLIQHPVVRGPLPNNFVVRDTLNPTKGSVYGNAHVSRRFPLLPKLGGYDSGTISNPLLHNTFTNGEMGIPNWHRRVPSLYQLPMADPSYGQAYKQAILDMFAIPHWDGLRVLDRDVDWLEYRFHAPDFHPRVNSGRCELDRNVVQTTEVNRLIDVRKPDMTWRLGEISHLPRTLTQSFLNMYRSTLQQFQNELQNVPPPPPDRVIYLTQQIPILQAKINLLEQFEPRIGPFENMLAIRP